MTTESNQFLAKDHPQLTAQLAIYGIEATASEVHGIACGLVCANTAMSTMLWPKLIRDPSEADEELPTTLDQNLGSLMETLRQQLVSPEFEFAIMLPTDDSPAEERLGGLAEWCQGYSLGFFVENERAIETLPGDSAEILRDIIEIAGADQEIDPDDLEEADRFLVEIEEYLRVGVQLIFEEIQDELDAKSEQQKSGTPPPGADNGPPLH